MTVQERSLDWHEIELLPLHRHMVVQVHLSRWILLMRLAEDSRKVQGDRPAHVQAPSIDVHLMGLYPAPSEI